jgi:3-dehydroquinate synthase
MSTTVTVALGERSYPIYIGADALSEDNLAAHIAGSQVAVVTNEVVAPLWLDALKTALGSKAAGLDVFELPDGEAEKTLDNYAAILDFLITRRHNRSTTVIALGGGVVGDMAGFAAATYQRGVNFLQVPTTLLAQVDSSVGGKTAVNHSSGKNLIGAFYQPQAVFADLRLLETLPQRELKAGLAEVLKYGIIRDAEFFSWLTEHAADLLAGSRDSLTTAITRSVEIKADVVAADEREGGVRAILNYGHTFGHAIEALTGYGRYLHGEAVAIGMVMAADLSWRSGFMSVEQASAIKQAVASFDLPLLPPQLSAQSMLEAMGMDKKVVDGRLRLILARNIGEAFVTDEVDAATLQRTLEAGQNLCEGSAG